MATAYQYTIDGYFVGECEDHGLLPNNATYTQPPSKNGYIPRWAAGKWSLVEDHVGVAGYLDGTPHTITDYGPLPDGWSDTPPPKPFAEVLVSKRAAINAAFEAAITASLTMPSATMPPSAFAIFQAIEAWKTEDPEGFSLLLAIHTTRRDALLASVESAKSVEELQAITVSYAV